MLSNACKTANHALLIISTTLEVEIITIHMLEVSN